MRDIQSAVPNAKINGIPARASVRIEEQQVSVGNPWDPETHETVAGPKTWHGEAVLERPLPTDVRYDTLTYEGPITDPDGEALFCTGKILIDCAPELLAVTAKDDGVYPQFIRGGMHEITFVGTGAPKIMEEA